LANLSFREGAIWGHKRPSLRPILQETQKQEAVKRATRADQEPLTTLRCFLQDILWAQLRREQRFRTMAATALLKERT